VRRISPEEDRRATEFFRELEQQSRATPAAALPDQVYGLQGEPVKKSLEDYARMMVAQSGNYTEPAQWVHNKDEYVRHFKGTTFIAIGAIARKVAMQPAKVYRRNMKSGSKTPVDWDHPLVQLFEAVNPIHTQFDLWYQMVCYRLMTGDSYWWKTRNRFGGVVELWPLPSQWVWAIPSATRFIDRYLVRNMFGPDTFIDQQDVLHIREPSIDYTFGGRFYGKPVITAADVAIDLEEAMFKRLYHSFRNFTPPGMAYSTDEKLSEQEFLDLLAQFKAQQKRAEQTGEPILTHSGMKAGDFRSSIREMDYGQSLDKVMDYILAVMGTPRAVVGLVADQNRANLDGAILCWAENTVNPLLRHMGQHLTQNLAVLDFGPDIVVEFDPITTDDHNAILQSVNSLRAAGAITPNEQREILLKLPPYVHGGNRPILASALAEFPMGNGPASDADEPPPDEGEAASGPPAATPVPTKRKPPIIRGRNVAKK